MMKVDNTAGTDLETPGRVIGALLALYYRQESDEREGGFTAYQNGMGFNALDAGVLSDMARFYLQKGYLSPKQVSFVKGRLGKYSKQLAHCEIKDMPNTWEDRAAQTPTTPSRTVDMQGTRTLIVSFTFDPRLLDEVKRLPGRKWDSESKTWHLPASYKSAKRLQELGFTFSAQTAHWWKGLTVPADLTPYVLPSPPGKSLRPFQEEGVAFLDSRGGRGYIADEMGLGKTPQSLAWIFARKATALPAVVICPASVKYNWEREAATWTGLRTHVITGTASSELPEADIYIINYEIVSKWQKELEARKLKTAVLDESHSIKTPSAQRTLAIAGGEVKTSVTDPETGMTEKKKVRVRGLCEKLPHVICLSGTPILNRPIELFTSLRLLRPDLFPSFWRYAERYCGATNNGFGWEFGGATNIEELHSILTSTIMLRRLKKDVLRELPPKMRTVLPVEITNHREYRKAETDLQGWIKENIGQAAADAATRAEALVRIEKLKQLAFKGKIHACIEWIEDYLSQNDKLVVFAAHQAVIDEVRAVMHRKGHGPVVIDGRTPVPERQAAVDAFQTDPDTRVFIGNIKAAGVGITLTAASATCFLELEWTPGLHDQAEDRVHRFGQEADSVFAYYLLARDTVEEEIAELIDNKRRVLDAVLDGRVTEESAVLTALLKKYAEEN